MRSGVEVTPSYGVLISASGYKGKGSASHLLPPSSSQKLVHSRCRPLSSLLCHSAARCLHHHIHEHLHGCQFVGCFYYFIHTCSISIAIL